MGFMGGIFKALGFEGDSKPKAKKVKNKTKASFSLKDDKASRPDQIDGVAVYYPESFDQIEEFAVFVKKNRAIIISTEFCDKEVSQRIVDYIKGFTFGCRAKYIVLEEDKLYLILPEGMEIEE